MSLQFPEIDSYYTKLFTECPAWSTPFPNPDEAARWEKICSLLAQIAEMRTALSSGRLRILDVGCGRGWLTRLASVYGQCDGVDPVTEPVRRARTYFPDLNFFVGTAQDIRGSEKFEPYDIVITSEVIEHVISKDQFVSELKSCLVPGGHVIITTPRGELYRNWRRAGNKGQPVESWISEANLQALFVRHQFQPTMHDRVYIDCSRISLLNRICASRKARDLVGKTGLEWLLRGMQYAAGLYQVWWFTLRDDP